MTIHCTNTFKSSFEKHCKKKNHYSCLEKRILELIANYNAFSSDLITRIPDSELSIVKIRLKSCTNKGKSSGFRVVTVENRDTKNVCILDVYAHFGQYNKSDISDQELEGIVNEFINSYKANTLIQVSSKRNKLKFPVPNEVN